MTPEEWDNFRDVRTSKPRRGDVMAQYQVVCEFGDGAAKRQIVNALRDSRKAQAIVQVMRKLHFAHPRDAVSMPLAMVKDMLEGMTPEEVYDKPYHYLAEMFFYVDPKYVPAEDKHWTIIPLEFPSVSCYIVDGKEGKPPCSTGENDESSPGTITPTSNEGSELSGT
jgi:hypothetical protein